eukprot:g17815.t1
MRSTFTAADDLLRGSEGRAPPLPHQYAPPGKFIFRPRTSRVNWRLLHSLDLDRVIREGDVDMIQAHMENITFARFSREDLEVTSDECIIKVVQLSQLCMEFLMATCSASQHLIQGLTERVRVQAAQLKVADTRRRSERPSRRPPPERAPMPQVFVRKTEQYLYEHMSRRHIADVFEPPPLSNTRLQEKPPEPEPVLRDVSLMLPWPLQESGMLCYSAPYLYVSSREECQSFAQELGHEFYAHRSDLQPERCITFDDCSAPAYSTSFWKLYTKPVHGSSQEVDAVNAIDGDGICVDP